MIIFKNNINLTKQTAIDINTSIPLTAFYLTIQIHDELKPHLKGTKWDLANLIRNQPNVCLRVGNALKQKKKLNHKPQITYKKKLQ